MKITNEKSTQIESEKQSLGPKPAPKLTIKGIGGTTTHVEPAQTRIETRKVKLNDKDTVFLKLSTRKTKNKNETDKKKTINNPEHNVKTNKPEEQKPGTKRKREPETTAKTKDRRKSDTQNEVTHTEKSRKPRKVKPKLSNHTDKGSIEKFLVRTTGPSVAANLGHARRENRDLERDQLSSNNYCIKSKSGTSPKGVEGGSFDKHLDDKSLLSNLTPFIQLRT